MRTETEHVDIACPQAHVWSVIEEVVRWPEWTPSIEQVVPLDRLPLAPGRRYRVLQPGMQPMVWTVTRLEPGVSFSWAASTFGMDVEAHHAVTPMSAGSRVGLQLDFHGVLGGLIASLARARNRRYLRMEAHGLKDRCESSWRDVALRGRRRGGGRS